MTPFQIQASDGVTLSGMCWKAAGETSAAVCLVHGLGEHIGRYDHVAAAFNQAGISLMGTDLRGHGKSEGKRGHTPTFEQLLDDVFQSLEKTRGDFPDQPLFLYGHSLGGLIVLTYALQRQPDLAGVIVSAPLLQLTIPPPEWKLGLLKILSALRLHTALKNKVDEVHISRDINVVRSYRNDPLTHHLITPPLALGMFQAGTWCIEHAREMRLPALLIHGQADQITSPQATRIFAEQAASDCTLQLLPGLFHEPHNEPEKAAVLKCLTEWTTQHAQKRRQP